MDELRRLAGRSLLIAFDGPALPAWAGRRLADGAGGVCLFGGNVPDLASVGTLTEAIRAASPAALTCLDEEGGDVTRLFYGLGSPHAGHAVLGAVDDLDLTARVAADIGWSLRAAGVDLDLGPVADVNSNPLNPVIGVRSFGADAVLVAGHTAAWVRGLQGTGVGACLKHFPGHGDTVSDSHVSLPVVSAPLEVLRRRELVPFRAGVTAGALAVMSSHVVVKGLDPERAATFSPAVVALLRAPVADGGIGFGGLLVSDALEMRGASGETGIPAAAVRALAAGVDLLCLGAKVDDDLVGAVEDAVVDAVRAGDLGEERLVEAAHRVDTVRATLSGLRADATAPPPSETRPSASDLAARRAIAVDGPLAPLRHAQVIRLVTAANQAVGRAPWGLPTDGAVLSGRPAFDLAEGDIPPPLHGDRPVVVLVRSAQRYAWARHALAALVAAHPELVVVEMGWPGPDPSPGRTVVRTYGASAVSGWALDRLLSAGAG